MVAATTATVQALAGDNEAICCSLREQLVMRGDCFENEYPWYLNKSVCEINNKIGVVKYHGMLLV